MTLLEEPVTFAEEDQVAGYSHPRVGSRAGNGILPGDLSRKRIYRSVNAVIRQ
jgi:hypothetical protein